MTPPLDPTLRALDACGCCDHGLSVPVAIHNRPGLSSIAYRSGTHSGFKAAMLARLSASDLPALNALTTRDDSDFTIALFDAWAAACDVLTFYQERIANECYVRTATERRSLLELGNLIGYLPRPGVAATAHLAFTIDAGAGAEDVLVPVGTRVQSIPGPGEKPQVFETMEDIVGRAEWNEMRPVLRQKHPALTADTKSVTVTGVTTNVQKGDSILVVFGSQTSSSRVKRVLRVTVDADAGTTTLALADDAPSPPPFLFALKPAIVWNPAPLKLTSATVQSEVLAGSWKIADLKAYAGMQRWPLAKLATNVVAQSVAQRKSKPPGMGVYAFRQRAAIFGHNAPQHLKVHTDQGLASWEGKKLSADAGAAQAQIDLDTTYPGIVKGSWVVLEDETRQNVYKVLDVSSLSRAAYTLSAKVSRLKLDSTTNFASYSIRATSVLAESEELELAELPVTDKVRGSRIVLDRAYPGLTVGRPVVVTGKRTDLDGVTDSEVMTIADVVLSDGYTEIQFVEALAHEYERASVTVNANVALSTHGETKDDRALGSGDATKPFQRFALPEAPLTYVAAANPKGAAPTLVVRVNGVEWQAVDFLYGRTSDDRVYIARTDDEGRTYVQFGDGRTGARLVTGRENVRATYRKGIGAEGLVAEDQLTLLLTKPLGVRSVRNAVAAADAADPETRDDVRRNAALPIRTLDRIVSLRDYEDFARAFTGISKALATWTWYGRRRGVFVTVAGTGGTPVNEGGTTYKNLVAALIAGGDPEVPLRVRTFVPAWFRVAATVAVDAAYQTDAVLAAVEGALRERFSFDVRGFGQPVAKSEVIAAMQSVPGVVAVDLDELHRTDATAAELASRKVFDRLPAAAPVSGSSGAVAAELLLLDPRPVRLAPMKP